MRLLAVPNPAGMPILWINADHLVSVGRLQHGHPEGIDLTAELKVDGMPLERVKVGVFPDIAAADAAWSTFLTRLEAGE